MKLLTPNTKVHLKPIAVAAQQLMVDEQIKHQVRSAVLYNYDLHFDTEETDFDKLFDGDFMGKGKNKISSAEALCRAIVKCSTAYVLDYLFSDADKRSFQSNAFDARGKLDPKNIAKDLSHSIRLKKGKSGYQISIPFGHLDASFDRIGELLRKLGRGVGTELDILIGQLTSLFGTEFFDLSHGVDKSVDGIEVLKFERANFKWDKEEYPLTDSFIATLKSGVKKVRFTSPQIADAKWPAYYLNEGDTKQTKVSNINEIDNDFDRQAFARHVAEVRLNAMMVSAVLEIEKGHAQAVAQQEYAGIKNQYLAAWVQGNVEFALNARSDAADYMTPLTTIREFNKTSRYNGKKKTNDAGLLVTRQGNIMYIPEVDNIEYVESQIESECTLENGEWSLHDAINPETNNFETKAGKDAVIRKYKKTKGASRVVYTDWKNSKFSYTDTGGALRVIDLNSARPVTATHIVRFLKQNIDTLECHNAIVTALANAKETKSLFDPTEEELRQLFPATGQDKALDILGLWKGDQFSAYLRSVLSALHQTSNRANPIEGTPEFLEYLDENYNKGLMLSEIHENSPVMALRCIWRTMNKVQETAKADIDQFTKGRSVISALNELGFAAIVTSYGGKGRQVIEEDRLLRQKYVEPDLLPVRDITVDRIPFVKDIKMLPHQVKSWNYLKNLPKLAILDVAAGGGKTILCLLDIANLLGQGLIKKPLVLCPNTLIKNYINDANAVFGGRMNIVVLNGETMASWGAERLTKLVDKAPINTIFLSSFDFFKSNKEYASYGTFGIETSVNADFMRQFHWDYVAMDESHKLKNEDSQTTKAVLEVVADIEYKRQLTGTYTPDSITDVVAQFAAMNPTVFGTRDTFEKMFKDENAGRGAWIDQAERKVRQAMKENCNVVEIRRREWRALLPDLHENFWPVKLTVNQSKVYNDILDETTERLRELIAKDPKLQAMMEEQDGNEEVQEALASILNPYLQRLEKFLSDPTGDAAGKLLTDEDDQVSPKLQQAYELIRKHLTDGTPGKILIFTQYKSTAQALYDKAPADLKGKIIHYTSGNKVKSKQVFENDPSKMIMVGVETSMNTGLNLQFCSRLIRMETVWNWGNLEQGEARILRPNIKIKEFRDGIYFDWIFCDKTVDVTKTSRMIAKLVSTAKFNESEDANFQNLPKLDMVRLSIKSIAARNSYEDPDPKVGLMEHFNGYQAYRRAETASFEEFKRDPLNRTEDLVLEEGHILPGSGMLQQVPYIADMELYGMDDLGLVKYAEYMNDNAPPGLEDPINEVNPTDLKIHTEDGDGVCVGPGTRTIKTTNEAGETISKVVQTGSIRVRLNNGSVGSYAKSNVFVITKKFTNARAVREAMGMLSGAQTDRPIIPKDVPAVPVKPPKGKKSANEQVELDKKDVKLYLVAYNEFMCLSYDESESPNVDVKAMADEGFKPVRSYYYAIISRWQALEKWIELATDKFHIEPKFLAGLEHTAEQWKKSRNNLHLMQQLNVSKLRDFLRYKMSPPAKGEIKPFIMVMDDQVHLCLDSKTSAPMFGKVKSVRVPGVTWYEEESDDHLMFMRTKGEVRDMIEKIGQTYNITNKTALVKLFNEVRVITAPTK